MIYLHLYMIVYVQHCITIDNKSFNLIWPSKRYAASQNQKRFNAPTKLGLSPAILTWQTLDGNESFRVLVKQRHFCIWPVQTSQQATAKQNEDLQFCFVDCYDTSLHVLKKSQLHRFETWASTQVIWSLCKENIQDQNYQGNTFWSTHVENRANISWYKKIKLCNVMYVHSILFSEHRGISRIGVKWLEPRFQRDDSKELKTPPGNCWTEHWSWSQEWKKQMRNRQFDNSAAICCVAV